MIQFDDKFYACLAGALYNQLDTAMSRYRQVSKDPHPDPISVRSAQLGLLTATECAEELHTNPEGVLGELIAKAKDVTQHFSVTVYEAYNTMHEEGLSERVKHCL